MSISTGSFFYFFIFLFFYFFIFLFYVGKKNKKNKKITMTSSAAPTPPPIDLYSVINQSNPPPLIPKLSVLAQVAKTHQDKDSDKITWEVFFFF
jgi:hypothetical protein